MSSTPRYTGQKRFAFLPVSLGAFGGDAARTVAMKTTSGEVRGLGRNYSDGREALEIWIPLARAKALPNIEGQRVQISLQLRGQQYVGGLRSTSRNPYVWICPDLRTEEGAKVSLARVLETCGFRKNQRVALIVKGKSIEVGEVQ